jgi:hypothetical protein
MQQKLFLDHGDGRIGQINGARVASQVMARFQFSCVMLKFFRNEVMAFQSGGWVS